MIHGIFVDVDIGIDHTMNVNIMISLYHYDTHLQQLFTNVFY